MVARSSTEAEFWTMALGVCKGMWLNHILKKLRVENSTSVKLFCDNLSTISIAKNLFHHNCTKHVKIDRYFIK